MSVPSGFLTYVISSSLVCHLERFEHIFKKEGDWYRHSGTEGVLEDSLTRSAPRVQSFGAANVFVAGRMPRMKEMSASRINPNWEKSMIERSSTTVMER